MCGISAVCGPAQGNAIEQMLDAISHRGGDEQGVYTAQDISLGIQRLSVMGLADGSQPLLDPCSRVSLVCNGEIYNHKSLRTEMGLPDAPDRSDIDVLLHLYIKTGSKMFSSLDGMFAIIIYDEKKTKFVAARDRFGIKPLYYIESGETWYFASEMKALGVIGEDESLIQEVPPGCFMTKNGIEAYCIDTKLPASMPQPALLRGLLEASIEKQLQADPGIRFGVFLSGGLGSSILAALAARHRPGLVAFTVGTEESPDAMAARQVASHLGIRLVSCIVDQTNVESQLERAVEVTETYNPTIVFEGLLTMRLAEAAALEGVKVILSGEGGHVLFAEQEGLHEDFYGYEGATSKDTRRDLLIRLNNTGCRKLDRATSAYSVEARVPFLDYLVVDWAVRLPSEDPGRHSIDQHTKRNLLRAAFRDLLPPSVVARCRLTMGRGSGLRFILQHFAETTPSTTSERHWSGPQSTEIMDKATQILHTHWTKAFGKSGGRRMHDMFF